LKVKRKFHSELITLAFHTLSEQFSGTANRLRHLSDSSLRWFLKMPA